MHHNHVQLDGHDVSVINADGSQSHNTKRDQVPNRIINWLVQRGYIKEDTEWILAPHAIDPVVSEKVRRIKAYGIPFELDFMGQVMYWSSRLFGRS